MNKMDPEIIKQIFYDQLRVKIEELFILDRMTNMEDLSQHEILMLILDDKLTIDNLVEKFREIIKPYIIQYADKMVNP